MGWSSVILQIKESVTHEVSAKKRNILALASEQEICASYQPWLSAKEEFQVVFFGQMKEDARLFFEQMKEDSFQVVFLVV